MKHLILSVLVLGISGAFAAEPATNAPSPIANEVVARINGSEIKRDELNAAMKGLMLQFAQAGRSIQPEQMNRFERDVLDELINRELVLQQARTKPPADIETKVTAEVERTEQQVGGREELTKMLTESGITLDQYKQRVRDNLIVQGAMLAMMQNGTGASTDEVKEFYEKNKERFKQPDLVRARHILIRVPPTAEGTEKDAKKAQIDALLVRLKAGEDFGALAKQFSEDPGSGANGGDLGFFPKGAMVPEFDLAAFSMQTNQLSEVISTQFGYHVLQVTEKQPARELGFDEVKDRIEKGLQQQKGVESARKHIDELRQGAKVEVLLPAPVGAPAQP